MSTNSQLPSLNEQILSFLATGMRTVVAPASDIYASVSEAQGGDGMNYTLGADTPLATDFSFVYRDNNYNFGFPINEQVVKVSVGNENLGDVYSESSVVDIQNTQFSQKYAQSIVDINPNNAPGIDVLLRDDHRSDSVSSSDVLTHDLLVDGQSVLSPLSLISETPTQTDLGTVLNGPNGMFSGISSAADPITSALSTLVPAA